MFIRAHHNTNKKLGKTYTTYLLVENKRYGSSTHQETILNLGQNFDLPKDKWKGFCIKIERELNNAPCLFESSFNKEYDLLVKDTVNKIIAKRNNFKEKKPTQSSPDYIKVNKTGIRTESIRQVGPEHVALTGVEKLGLPTVFQSLGYTKHQVSMALGTIASRMVHPSSERETYRWFNQDSALGELLDLDISSDNALHRISDLIYSDKDNIEYSINQNVNNIFHTSAVVSFYDLTNTYFEGRPNIDKAKHGHSKEKRTDCPLISLGLVLDLNGFIIRSEIFPGNVSEPSTLKDMMTKLGATKVGQVVMDRGIATADNIKWLKENNYSYLVVNRESKRIFDFAKAIEIKTKTNNIVKIYKELTEDGSEARLYCYSENRELKESAIWLKKVAKFEAELKKIDEGLTKPRCQRAKTKIDMRIGRLLQKYSGIAQHYNIQILDNSATKSTQELLLATKIIFKKDPLQGSMLDKPGIYCIKSNILTMTAEEMWGQYVNITDIEAVFRSLKSDLGLRPIFHQTHCRVESHIFITLLAYQCIQMIRKILNTVDINESWDTIRHILASHGRVTIVLPTDKGVNERIRITSDPENWQVNIYRALRITNYPGPQLR
jgi:transposase